MRVLITGGAGFIGSTLSRMLLERGHEVVILDRLFFGKNSIKDIEDMIKLVQGDTRYIDSSIMKGVDAVIDMAALSTDASGEIDPTKTLDINHLGRVRIAKMAKQAGVKKYVLASSCSVYGFSDKTVDEKSKTNPLTTYAKSNIFWENDTLPLADKNFSVAALRQATVYGFSYKMRYDLAINGMTLGFFKNGKIPIMRDGTQYRSFVHVKDTSNAFIKVIESDHDIVSGQTFNVGSNDQNFQIFELAELIAKSIGVPFNYEWYGEPDTISYKVAFDKIKEVLKFKPKFTPVEGSKEVFAALKDGTLKVDDPRTHTANWYKHLIKERPADVILKGSVL